MKELVIQEVKRDILCDVAGCANKRQYAVYRTSAGSRLYLCGECLAALAALAAWDMRQGGATATAAPHSPAVPEERERSDSDGGTGPKQNNDQRESIGRTGTPTIGEPSDEKPRAKKSAARYGRKA